MELQDSWLNRKSIADDFKRAMDGPQERKGNPDEIIDYSNLKVDENIAIEKSRKKC